MNLLIKVAWIIEPYCVTFELPVGAIWIAVYLVYHIVFEFTVILSYQMMSICNYYLAT